MNLKRCQFLLILIVLQATVGNLVSATTVSNTKASEKQEIRIEDLEGRWQITKTDWDDGTDYFVGGVFEFKFVTPPIMINDGSTQFIVSLNSTDTRWYFNNEIFCAVQNAQVPENTSLYIGYYRLEFWELSDYPCGMMLPKSDGDGYMKDTVSTYGPKKLFRLKLEGPRNLKAVIYHESGLDFVLSEKKLPNELKDASGVKCEKSICYCSNTMSVGVFEMSLVKIGSN